MTLTPPDVERKILSILQRIENGQSVLATAEESYAEACREYDWAYARAYLDSKGSNAESRKMEAVLAAKQQRMNRDVKEMALLRCKNLMKELYVEADLWRTLSASVRASMS